jgi:hypothetical protein
MMEHRRQVDPQRQQMSSALLSMSFSSLQGSAPGPFPGRAARALPLHRQYLVAILLAVLAGMVVTALPERHDVGQLTLLLHATLGSARIPVICSSAQDLRP